MPRWREQPASGPVRGAIATKSSARAGGGSGAGGPGPEDSGGERTPAHSRCLSFRRFRGCLLQRPKNVQILPKSEQETKEEAAQVRQRRPPRPLPSPQSPGKRPAASPAAPARSGLEQNILPGRRSAPALLRLLQWVLPFILSPRPK